MVYLALTPSPPLDTFVERIWYCSDAAPHARERVLPGGGTVDLFINLVDDEIKIYDPVDPELVRAHSGSLVSGTSTRSVLVDPRQRKSVIGVHFRPGGAFPFLGISPSEIIDSQVGLEDLWGCTGRSLREQLSETVSPSDRFRLIQAELLRRLCRARPGHPAARAGVRALSAGGNGPRVAEVATLVGLSHRRFIEVFEREVGVTPKVYVRLQRFHRVKQRLATLEGAPSWATFALACGYFDQSHMIRDFVAFSGMTPASYLRCRTDETSFDHFVHAYPGAPGAAQPRDSRSRRREAPR
jgi:AraC-like DNA-binding protein